jgi:hypothetical protein
MPPAYPVAIAEQVFMTDDSVAWDTLVAVGQLRQDNRCVATFPTLGAGTRGR